MFILHWEQLAHEDPHYGHDAHRREERRHEKQHDFHPRGDRRRRPNVANDSDGQVTDRASGHRAQS